MPNTTKNKGGLVLKKAGSETFSVPFETLDSLDFDIQRKLNEMDETPYNRLYMVYDLKSVDEATDTHTIPLSLKIKATPIKGKNVFLVSPESPIGNLLLVPGIDGLMVERENDLLFDNKILTPQASEGQYTPGFKGHLPGERIHDIKTADDFVRNLGPIYTAMDREINLEEFASRFKDRPQKPNGKTTPNVKKDMAQTANGGIDLNAGNLQMEINGEKIDLKFDPAMVEQFQRGDFSGVAPVIIQITAIQNPMSLLGVDLGKEEEAVLH
jgi:hypothetical protein